MTITLPRQFTGALIAAALVTAALAAPPRPAEADAVTVRGPYGGEVRDLAVSSDGSTVLAATGHGIFRSTDGAQNWRRAVIGIPDDATILAVVFSPQDPALAYASGEEIWRSTDAGATWAEINSPSTAFFGDLIIPRDPQGALYAKGSQAVYRTDNGGVTWSAPFGPPRTNAEVETVAVAPSDPSRIYVSIIEGTGADVERSLWRTSDGGVEWVDLDYGQFLRDIAVDPNDPDVFLGSTMHELFRFADGGTTAPTRLDVPGGTYAVEFPATSSDVIVASGTTEGGFLAYSGDGGTTWNASPVPFYGRAVAADPTVPSTIYGGLDTRGVVKSVDAALTVSPANNGLTAAPVTSIAFSRTTMAMYAALGHNGEGGVFRSGDGGNSWIQVDHDIPADANDPHSQFTVEGLAVDAVGTVFALRGDASGQRVVRSADEGLTWTEGAAQLPRRRGAALRLVAHKSSAGTLLAGMAQTIGDSDDGGVFRTDDGGASWNEVGAVPHAMFDVSHDRRTGRVLAGSYSIRDNERVARLHVSDDFGSSWARIPFSNPTWCHERVATIGAGQDTYYVGTMCGTIFRTMDGGATWQQFEIAPSDLIGDLHALALDPEDPTQLVAGTSRGGTWISGDQGETWRQLAASEYGHAVFAIEFAPKVPDPPAALDARPALIGAEASSKSGLWRMVPSPHARRRPGIQGTVKRGEKVRCLSRTWSRTDKKSFRWLRNGEPIPRATYATYTVRRADRGEMLKCQVVGKGPGGRARIRSNGKRVP